MEHYVPVPGSPYYDYRADQDFENEMFYEEVENLIHVLEFIKRKPHKAVTKILN